MIIFVGRWDLLPEDWEGINGLYKKTVPELEAEVRRESNIFGPCPDDRFIGMFTPEEFEEELNHFIDDGRDEFSPITHWIKVTDGRRVLVTERITEPD